MTELAEAKPPEPDYSMWPRRNDREQVHLARKSYALKVARSVAQSVDNRRKRAEVKAEFYKVLMTLLEKQATSREGLEVLYRKTVLSLFGCLAVAVAIISLLIAFI